MMPYRVTTEPTVLAHYDPVAVRWLVTWPDGTHTDHTPDDFVARFTPYCAPSPSAIIGDA